MPGSYPRCNHNWYPPSRSSACEHDVWQTGPVVATCWVDGGGLPKFHLPSWVGVGWGGVGWDINVIALAFSCTYTSTSCYAAVSSAMHLQTYVLGWGGVGWDIHVIALAFSCTYTSTSCYAAACFYALIHLRHATQLRVLMHLYMYVMLRCCVFSCTYTCTSTIIWASRMWCAAFKDTLHLSETNAIRAKRTQTPLGWLRSRKDQPTATREVL